MVKRRWGSLLVPPCRGIRRKARDENNHLFAAALGITAPCFVQAVDLDAGPDGRQE
jgi:hypothetical protein